MCIKNNLNPWKCILMYYEARLGSNSIKYLTYSW